MVYLFVFSSSDLIEEEEKKKLFNLFVRLLSILIDSKSLLFALAIEQQFNGHISNERDELFHLLVN